MGIYADYINKKYNWPQLEKERKKQLKRITDIRKRAVLSYAGAYGKQADTSISFNDRVPFFDQLSNIEGDEIDVIIETPGGSAEIVEDLIRVIRSKFSRVGMIIPGYAKSAGTIFVMSGDEILMESSSALGPIDAQMVHPGKMPHSAHAFLEGFKNIKEEVTETGTLNRAYIPILQNISPADIQACENAQDFSKDIVTKWLSNYKFKFWEKHSKTGKKVTKEEKQERAEEIAEILCNHKKWLSHGRSITIKDLRERMRLKITDYCENEKLCDAIRRYYILLRMTFETTPIFKIIETPESQIYRHEITQQVTPKSPVSAIINITCSKCGKTSKIQANFKKGVPLDKQARPFPKDNKFICPKCGQEHDTIDIRREIESQTSKKILEG
ncbi:Clp protease ClpP [Candidatus Latescibacterota bacterium]